MDQHKEGLDPEQGSADSRRAPRSEWATTAIHLPKRTLTLLRRVAFHRAETRGGRMSVSRLLTDLVEAHRADLELEIEEQPAIN